MLAPTGKGIVFRRFLLVVRGVLRRAEFEVQPVDLAGELERADRSDTRSSRRGVRVSCPTSKVSSSGKVIGVVCSSVFLATSLPSTESIAGAALAKAGAVVLEVEADGVLARLQFGPFPDSAFEVEQIVEEHDFAPAESSSPLLRNKP